MNAPSPIATFALSAIIGPETLPTGLIVQPGHVELDTTAKYGLSRALTLWLTGRNLTSESYSDALGFPAPERRLRLGISSEFK